MPFLKWLWPLQFGLEIIAILDFLGWSNRQLRKWWEVRTKSVASFSNYVQRMQFLVADYRQSPMDTQIQFRKTCNRWRYWNLCKYLLGRSAVLKKCVLTFSIFCPPFPLHKRKKWSKIQRTQKRTPILEIWKLPCWEKMQWQWKIWREDAKRG